MSAFAPDAPYPSCDAAQGRAGHRQVLLRRHSSTRDGHRHGNITDQGWFKRPKKIGVGNLALTDGSVQEANNITLPNYVSETGLGTNRLVIP